MLKRDISTLLLFFVVILIALGALAIAGKRGFAIGKKPAVQITTQSGAKIDNPAPRPK